MALARLYIRVLLQLGPEMRLALLLVLANLLLAVAQFVEPWLFGQIINVLTAAQGTGGKPKVDQLLPLIGAWLVFGCSRSRRGSRSRCMPTGFRIASGCR